MRRLIFSCCVLAACNGSTPKGGGDGGGAVDLAMGGPPAGASVTQFHNSATRDGVFVDARITKQSAAGAHKNPAFNATVTGSIYGQLLFVDGMGKSPDLVFAATERNNVYALDAATGAVVWSKTFDTPATQPPLPCGNIFPLGITGTPTIDLSSRTIYFDEMAMSGNTLAHKVFALSIDDGSTRAGWPIDVSAKVTGFLSQNQNQRGALLLLNGTLYVPYGGHYGDCGDYHGWVIAIDTTNPANVKSWSTRSRESGAWACGGVASDGTSIFVATGNGASGSTWSDQEAIIRLGPGATYSMQASDYFHPTDWVSLDNGDVDIGGSGPILFSVPPVNYVAALGKNGKAYLLDRSNLGGQSEGLASDTFSSSEIINAGAAYTTSSATYLAFKGAGTQCPANQSGNLIALKIDATSPPTMTTAWCADQMGEGSPMVTTSDGKSDAIVWAVGAEGDNRLHGFDGDTGAIIFGGGGAGDVMKTVRRFHSPIAAKGHLYVGADNAVYDFIAN